MSLVMSSWRSRSAPCHALDLDVSTGWPPKTSSKIHVGRAEIARPRQSFLDFILKCGLCKGSRCYQENEEQSQLYRKMQRSYTLHLEKRRSCKLFEIDAMQEVEMSGEKD